LSDEESRVIRAEARITKALKVGSYDAFNEELISKRLEWYEKVGDRLHLKGPSVRVAYSLFLLEYLGLSPDEVPVVYEDARRIVWRSHNFCPVLEACKRLGLDTADVCRKSQERPVQELIARVDPRLKFSRNYQSIRPKSAFCEEAITLE
jgi:tRNA(adenine34) deaminase